MKISTHTVTACCLLCSLMLLRVAYAGYHEDVYTAAETGLKRMLDSIPRGSEAKFGFNQRDEFAKTTLGQPYQMYTVRPEVMEDGKAFTDDMLISVEEWRFPIISGTCIRALLTVAKLDDRWQAVDIGAANLAAEIDILEKDVSQTAGKKRRIILRFYQIRTEYIAIQDSTEAITKGSLYPVKSGPAHGAGAQDMKVKRSPVTFQEELPGLREKFRNVRKQPL